MLDDNVVKLVDFGVSEMFDKENADDPRDLKTGGSPAFMSPELCVCEFAAHRRVHLCTC
jgi:[calcium/calmodulin-dependent protein kinase] kinase